jgi:hypothetical protein
VLSRASRAGELNVTEQAAAGGELDGRAQPAFDHFAPTAAQAVFPFAVGDADYLADLRPLRGRHQPRNQGADIGLSQVVLTASGSVRVRPLKDMLEEAGVTRVDTLKVDVETFEDRVVPPFFDATAPSLWPRRICLEPTTYCGRASIHRFLEDRGYREIGRTRKNSLWQRG